MVNDTNCVNFFKVNELPAEPLPDSFYYVKTEAGAKAYLTDYLGSVVEVVGGGAGGGGGAAWGEITGDIEDQSDLVLFVDSKIGDIGLFLDSINGEVV